MSASTPSNAPAYSPGLAGVIAGESAICYVDENAGLRYRGYNVHDLADNATFEHVAFLLIHSHLPDAAHLKQFQAQLVEHARLPEDVEKILKLLPHRYPFLLIDRAVDYVANTSIRGIKNVTINEPFFPGHFPGAPVMPGVLQIEALAQNARCPGDTALEPVNQSTGGPHSVFFSTNIQSCYGFMNKLGPVTVSATRFGG